MKSLRIQHLRLLVSHFWLAVVLFLMGGCHTPARQTLFESVSPSHTRIDFINKVKGDDELNIFNYRNFYNGGGVAIGDINNDGLPDIFLVSNMGDNQLYLNRGNFVFENISEKAGIKGTKAWSTGATFADVNGDGWLDIYVCNAGNRANDDRSNELFINQKDGTFKEMAKQYGLDDKGFSTHAAFFDYDKDGDLDMYLLNNSFIPVGRLGYANLRNKRDSLGGHKLFRNDGNVFVDVSEQAGIYGSIIGFGLGITIGDVNNDNWPDIYISNDFYERDYLYINNHDGTFKETIEDAMPHISLSSMGADIADINNDGYLDIFVTDMLPENVPRLRRTSTYEGYDLYQIKLSRDFHHQFMQNMLQLNNGNSTFSEVSRMAGVEATDWSWGALMFDMDDDGLKDIFVANGINKDVTDQDFINYLSDERTIQKFKSQKKFDFRQLVDKMPSTPIPNYAFKNDGDIHFENKTTEWGVGGPGFSNGAAYGDLDNDGDLDLVVNNENALASVFRNTSVDKEKKHYLRVRLQGTRKNKNAIGAKVYLYANGSTQLLQQMPNRGFESSVDQAMVFGLGNNAEPVDSLVVIWPSDSMQKFMHLPVDREMVLKQADADALWKAPLDNGQKLFSNVTAQTKFDYQHKENLYADFHDYPLLKQMYSTQGPALATGDVNGDGLDDICIGSAKGYSMRLYLQNSDGSFTEKTPRAFLNMTSEIVDAILFDADNDHDLDLFVVTGGNEYKANDPELRDHLFINDGKGVFVNDDDRIPNIVENGGCVAAADFDRDGDIDLFIGGRLESEKYGQNPPSYFFINDGTGHFKNYMHRYFPTQNMGMVTDAVWEDIDNDGYKDLIVVGDWMPVTIFKNMKGESFSLYQQFKFSDGWWNSIEPADVDGDGDLDFVLGNTGMNMRYEPDSLHPQKLYVNDFSHNGSTQQIITAYSADGKSYPIVLKHDLETQLPFIKRKFVQYSDYADKQLTDLFTPDQLKGATVRQAFDSRTSLLINEGHGHFVLKALPWQAQISPVHATQVMDFNSDGKMDLLLCGNFTDYAPETTAMDASYGTVLIGLGDGQFKALSSKDSGFFIRGQVRKMSLIHDARGNTLMVVARNNDTAQIFRLNRHQLEPK